MVTTLLPLGLFVAIVVLAVLATWTRLPYAILLVVGGIVLGFLPGLPRIAFEPEVVLLLFLPPLVYSSAWLTLCWLLAS
jgi:CPA1 family monovalent cation:H+ antiporter